MPDEVTAAEITAAGQVVTAGINYASGANQNRRQRKWSEDMYAKQRADALADWAMQNEYNSPAANMARLKAAGLNPNLVYGDGANSPSANMRSSEVPGYKHEAPKLDVSGAADSILAIAGQKKTETETDNLRLTRELINQQILNTAANTQNVGQQTEMSKFNLEQLRIKSSTDVAQVKANLNQTLANTQYTLDQNERAAAVNSVTIAEGLQKISNMRLEQLKIKQDIKHSDNSIQLLQHQIHNLASDNELKNLDIALKRQNIQPHDPAWQRTIADLLNHMPKWDKAGDMKKWQDFKKAVSEMVKKLGNNIPYNTP